MVTTSNKESVIVPCQTCGGSVSQYAMRCPHCDNLVNVKKVERISKGAAEVREKPADNVFLGLEFCNQLVSRLFVESG